MPITKGFQALVDEAMAQVTTYSVDQVRARLKTFGDGHVDSLLQRALDDDFLDVAGAFIDLTHTHIAVNALDREVAHIAVAT